MRWNACVQRLEPSFCSHPKEFFWREWSQNPCYSKGNIPSPGGSDRVEPSALYHTGQRVQHTINWAVPPLYPCFNAYIMKRGCFICVQKFLNSVFCQWALKCMNKKDVIVSIVSMCACVCVCMWAHTRWVLYSCLVMLSFKGKAKSNVMLQLMHSMCKSYSKTVVYFIHASSVLRKKAN